MNFLDALILAPLIYGAWKGFHKGLLFELAMILGLIAGVYIGFKCSGWLIGPIENLTGYHGSMLHFISLFLVVTAIVLVFIFYARLMEAVLKITSLNLFNKVAGAVFGMFKFALVISVLFWLLKPVEPSLTLIPAKTKQESLLYPYILKTAASLAPAVKDVRDEFGENFGK